MGVKIIHVIAGQTLWDIAVQEYKAAEAVFLVLMANRDVVGGITEELEPGMPLKIIPWDATGLSTSSTGSDAGYAASFMHWVSLAGQRSGRVQFRTTGNMLQWKYDYETSWKDLYAIAGGNIEFGSKSSSMDAGTLFDMSIDDDYLYVCVVTGDSGEAKWKQTPLRITM